jgi:hypothetical protein
MQTLGGLFSKKDNVADGPQIVMCSSAGVTRPSWAEEKKTKYPGAADIPIVRLNPFNILDVKFEGEEVLRSSGCDYSIVRPCGLNDDFPSGRPLLTQGDLAVGRINRVDVASLLVAISKENEATGKTFEAITLPQFPVPQSYDQQLGRLKADGQELSDDVLDLTYNIMQQMTPGEMLAPQNLAMGQTYEQLDTGEEGRLGKRGEETVPISAQ